MAYLSQEQVKFFGDNGFLHLKNVLSGRELERLRAESLRMIIPATEMVLDNRDYRYQMDKETGQRTLHRIDETQAKSDVFLHLCANPSLLQIGEDILGQDVLPIAAALVIKMPGHGVAVPWHQDALRGRVKPGINLGVYFDAASEETGMLYVVPGTHRQKGIDPAALVDEHGFYLPGAPPVPTEPGDVVIHSEDVLHGSRKVRGKEIRRVLYYGMRTIPEQLARPELGASWVRFKARLLHYAIARRAASEIGEGEIPYSWNPAASQYRETLSPEDYVERWIEYMH